VNSTNSLALQALVHASAGILIAWSLIAAASVVASPALYLATAWAFVTGLALSHITHEWCHFLGALAGRSKVTIKAGPHPLFFDFDFTSNSRKQFLWMSAGGLLGNISLLGIAALCLNLQSPIYTSFLAAVAGQLVYVLILEFPVSLAVMAGADPLAALTRHFGQGGPLFLRATAAGLGTAVLVGLLC
jgi:hypothetical protein